MLFEFLMTTRKTIKFLFDVMLIILFWANWRNLLKVLFISLMFLYFLSMVLWSLLVVPITQNVLTYDVWFPTSRDLSPIEDASVVIPTCLLRVRSVLHVLVVILYSDQNSDTSFVSTVLIVVSSSSTFICIFKCLISEEQMSGFTIRLRLIIAMK
jgi:hypothetical protein